MKKPRAMDDILPIILGAPFGVFVFIIAWKHAGELPPGPVRPGTRPPPPKAMPIATVTVRQENEPLNGVDDAPELDAEEKATIRRVNELRTRLESRRKALEAAGLEITNLDKWQ